MSVRGIEDVELFEGAVDADKYCDYLGMLVLSFMLLFDGVNPKIYPIIDNASIHHVDKVQEMMDNAGCLLWWYRDIIEVQDPRSTR